MAVATVVICHFVWPLWPEPLGSIGDVQPGVTLQIIMQAVNGNLQGVASDPIVVTMPIRATPVAEAQLTPAVSARPNTSAAVAPNGNGAAAAPSRV